jgi:hypothetical protein
VRCLEDDRRTHNLRSLSQNLRSVNDAERGVTVACTVAGETRPYSIRQAHAFLAVLLTALTPFPLALRT